MQIDLILPIPPSVNACYANRNIKGMRDMDFAIDRKKPRLEITIRLKGVGNEA